MKFFLAAIVTAALLSDIIPVLAATAGAAAKRTQEPPPAVANAQLASTSDRGISITPQAQARTQAAATAKVKPAALTKNHNNASRSGATVQSDVGTAAAIKMDSSTPDAKKPLPPKPVIKKIKPPVPVEAPLRVIWPQDFYYYSYNGTPYYSLSLPKDFGGDTLAGLPAAGPMLMRAAGDEILLTFAASASDPAQAAVFSDALKNRAEIPLPPLAPNEEYEYIPAPRYTYHTDPAPLDLPQQIIHARIIDAATGRTAENLLVHYLYLRCTVNGRQCLAALSRSERNQTAFTGLFVFPYAEKQDYLPLVTYTAQSLRVRK